MWLVQCCLQGTGVSGTTVSAGRAPTVVVLTSSGSEIQDSETKLQQLDQRACGAGEGTGNT